MNCIYFEYFALACCVYLLVFSHQVNDCISICDTFEILPFLMHLLCNCHLVVCSFPAVNNLSGAQLFVSHLLITVTLHFSRRAGATSRRRRAATATASSSPLST